jgi:RimJ/RimL family protein N-acetyltransferase
MQLIYGQDEAVCRFVNDRIDETFTPKSCAAVGVINSDGALVAGWVWHNYNPDCGTLEFSGASITAKWMTRAILQELFAYAFANVQMVVTRNGADNTRLHRQLAAFGFRRYDIERLFGRDSDGVVWTLTDDDWKASRFYIGAVNGQEIRSSRAA